MDRRRAKWKNDKRKR